MQPLELWDEAPASEWVEALPLGNGRLGAMVFGGVAREQLQLNESTFWSGGPYSPVNPDARAHVDEVRALIFAGRHAEAEALTDRYLMARPLKQMSFQPIGDLWLEFEHEVTPGSYRRSLDLDTAVTTTTYEANGTTFRREVFSSPADDVIVMRLSADGGGAISFTASVTSPQRGRQSELPPGVLGFAGTNSEEEGIPGALKFAFRAQVLNSGGRLSAVPGRVTVTDADEVLIIVDAGTSFRRFDDVGGDPIGPMEQRLATAAQKSFDALLAAHLREHRRLFRRLAIDLGTTPAAAKSTPARIASFATTNDPALAALYVQFGRYLMISSSRPGTQPANLQGIWNKETSPPWGSKYTANINLQMNYWLPDPANLSECFEPFIALVEDLSVTGAEMARAHYGARGWVMHHNTDLWRATGPVDGAQWGMWPTGGAWVCAQLWDHIAFAGNEQLVRRAYPLLKGAAQFILDVLQPLPGTGYLVTNPSVSPENVHPHGSSLCAGPTMDNQILRDLFDAIAEASTQLGIDPEFRAEVLSARDRLPPHRIGKAGQLLEWIEDWDMDVPEIHHRHVSHLYGLYPSWQINRDDTPELVAAAQRSLEIRGDNATGWGIGWRINLWARLGDGDHAHDVLKLLLSPERTYPNLLDAHPPFQIDGNFGGAAGIIEMLLQSRGGMLHLLPALPSSWPSGRVTGLRARGGLDVDLRWSEGVLTEADIRSSRPQDVTLRHGAETLAISLSAGAHRIGIKDGRLSPLN